VQLRELLRGIEVLEMHGDAHVEVSDLVHDSRRAHAGSCFACIRGEHADGHAYARAAVSAGAGSLLVERPLSTGVTEEIGRAHV